MALTAALIETIALARAAGRPFRLAGRRPRAALSAGAAVRAPDGTYPLFNDASLDAAPDIDQVVALGRGCSLQPAEVTARRRPREP